MPFTLYCHESSPEQFYRFFDKNHASLHGDQDEWSASYEFPGGLLRKKRTIRFTFDRKWCSPPNWPTQIQGMRKYVSKFEMPAKDLANVVLLIDSFNFSVGIVCDPEVTKPDDPRMQMIQEVARETRATVFTPGALLDSDMLVFASENGAIDFDAKYPNSGDPSTTSDESDIEPTPPTATRVAKRLYVMLAIAARGLLDMNLEAGNAPAFRLRALTDWVEAIGIADEFEPWERSLVYTPESGLTQQQTLDAVWTLEALVVLAWAIRLAELPTYDGLVNTDELLAKLSFLNSSVCNSNIANPNLRSPEELARFNQQIFAYHWRMVDLRVQSNHVDYANVSLGGGKLDVSWARLNQGDLEIGGAPITQADKEHVQTMMSAARERHRASNWLQGFARLYSDVGSDT